MDRLTIRSPKDSYWHIKDLPMFEASKTCIEILQNVVDHLAAYEDTGLKPEEINELLHQSYGPLHKKLGEWISAEQDGLLVMLPCKPGSIVQSKGNPAEKSRVDAVTVYADGRITFSFHEHGVRQIYVDEWSEDEAENYIPFKDIGGQ